MSELTTNETRLAGMQARVIYNRALVAFSRLLRACRQRKHLTVTTLARRTGIGVRRLTKMENATAPPQWHEAAVLSGALEVRVSMMINTVQRAVGPLSDDDRKALMAYVNSIRNEQRVDIRSDSPGEDFIRHVRRDGSDQRYCDATIANWPAFFPPTFEEDLLAEHVALRSVLEVLDAIGASDGYPTSTEVANIPPPERARWPLVPVGQLISVGHFRLLGICTRLVWIAQRHANHTPPKYVHYIDNQSQHLGVAMSLIAPHRGRVKVNDFELDDVDDCENFDSQTLDEVVTKAPLRPEDIEKENERADGHNRAEARDTFMLDLTTAVHHIARAGQMLNVMVKKLREER